MPDRRLGHVVQADVAVCVLGCGPVGQFTIWSAFHLGAGRELVRADHVDPTELISRHTPILSAVEAYEHFDRREQGWTKVVLDPALQRV